MKEYSKKRAENTESGRRRLKTFFHQDLEEIKEKNLLRKPACIQSSKNSKIIIEGKSFVNFASNDYLNLSGRPGIIKAASAAMLKYGFGSGASRLLSGTYSPHMKLEERIAAFKETEAALVFNTGYAANTGVIPVIAGRGDLVLSDELNHASIIDGLKLSGADVMIYRHKDCGHLESLLKKSADKKRLRRRVIITDTVFSMDGDIAPLNDLEALSREYDALLMIDDAHGTGVLGKTGRGGLEHFGIRAGDIIQIGTLSKAAGCYGAFAAGQRDFIELLINRARSFIYSTSLPPAVVEAGTRALEIIDSGSARLRKKLWKNTQRLNEALKSLGYDTLGSETPIIPILAGDVDNAIKIGKYLYENGVYAPAIRPPTVQADKCRIRFSVTAGHTDDDIDLVVNLLRKRL